MVRQLHLPLFALIALPIGSRECHAFSSVRLGDGSSRHQAQRLQMASDSQEPASTDRRSVIATAAAAAAASIASLGVGGLIPFPALAVDGDVAAGSLPEIQVAATGDAKKLFNEGRALEAQGNILAAQRLYAKVTKISPRFVFGWSNLGNTQVALGALGEAEGSYSTSIDLCREKNKETEQFGARRCDDLYLLLLNRGSLRLNNGDPKGALQDLEESDSLRGRPDAIILQNRARARELNGYYSAADKDYSVAISMTANEVAPFWLRAALVRFELGESKDAFNLLRRVENRFPEAPEVRAAYSAMLAAQGDMVGAQQKLLEIPDKARLRFVDKSYLDKVVAWPPAMKEALAKVTSAVGDDKRASAEAVAL
jgi:tetratricopeptide (TPR) repeat protein